MKEIIDSINSTFDTNDELEITLMGGLKKND